MKFGDMFGKAKQLADEHADQVEGAMDKAADAIKTKTPDNVDGYIDKGTDAAKGAIGDEPTNEKI